MPFWEFFWDVFSEHYEEFTFLFVRRQGLSKRGLFGLFLIFSYQITTEAPRARGFAWSGVMGWRLPNCQILNANSTLCINDENKIIVPASITV